jgi:hypothetical protein
MLFLFLAESFHTIHSAEASHNCPPFSPATVEPLKVKFQKCNREEIACITDMASREVI